MVGYPTCVDKHISDVSAAEFDAVICPGEQEGEREEIVFYSVPSFSSHTCCGCDIVIYYICTIFWHAAHILLQVALLLTTIEESKR